MLAKENSSPIDFFARGIPLHREDRATSKSEDWPRAEIQKISPVSNPRSRINCAQFAALSR
jgi:hypothetical protein